MIKDLIDKLKKDFQLKFFLRYVLMFICLTYTLCLVGILLFVDKHTSLNLLTSLASENLSVYSTSLCISFVIVILIYLKNLIFNKKDAYGDAHIATNHEISNMMKNGLFEKKGTILAKKSNAFIRTDEPLSVLIVAPQGTGKTAAVIIPSLLSNTSSAIVNDVKGELWSMTSLQRSRFGDVGLFAPSMGFEFGLKWNPFDKKCLPKSFNDQVDYVDRLASILYPTEQEGLGDTTKYFNSEAKTIFCFFTLYRILENGETSIPDINKTALETDSVQASVALILDENDELDENDPKRYPSFLTQLGNRILQKEEKEFGSCQSSFTQALEPFCRPNIARNLDRCDFTNLSFRQEKPFTLYIYVPANDIVRMAPIIRMLTEYLINEFLSDQINVKQRVTFYEDEFPRLGRLDSLKEAPALQRSFNISTIFVAQAKEQLEKIYGRGSFDHFLTVTDFKAIFTQNEDTTAARFSTLVGKTTRKKKSISSKDLEIIGSSSINDEGVPLFLPQDFMNIKKDNIIILAKGHHETPILAECAWWFKDKGMASLIGAYEGRTLEKGDTKELDDAEKAGQDILVEREQELEKTLVDVDVVSIDDVNINVNAVDDIDIDIDIVDDEELEVLEFSSN